VTWYFNQAYHLARHKILLRIVNKMLEAKEKYDKVNVTIFFNFFFLCKRATWIPFGIIEWVIIWLMLGRSILFGIHPENVLFHNTLVNIIIISVTWRSTFSGWIPERMLLRSTARNDTYFYFFTLIFILS
jgi:hypothetical protein